MTTDFDVDPDTTYAVGLDIGDGESCLLWIDTTDPDAEARLYERTRPPESTVLTALARNGLPPYEWIFGEAALLTRDAIQFEVNFKRMPSATQFGIPDAVLFAHAFLGEFFAAHPDVKASCQVLVGCPTGWPGDARDTYLQFLRTASLQVTLLPESQSALVHVWDLRRRQPVGDGRSADVDNVLVVDVGSSTVDVTMVTDVEPVNIECGTELGCADIDRELAETALTALAADPAFRAAMALDDAAAHLRMVCRRAKEAQFTGQELLLHDRQDSLNRRYAEIYALSLGWLRVQDIPLLVEQRWAARFHALLAEVAAKLPRPPEVVVLTGGGSRMPVTHRIAAQVFPAATLEQDATPSLSVGRGLASAGRHRLQALRFRREATGIATRPEVTEAFRAATVAAFTAVRNRTHETLRGLDPARWSAVLMSPPGIDAALRDLEATIDQTIRPLVNDVCADYAIPREQRNLGAEIVPPRVFTEEFMNRVSALPGRTDFPSDIFNGNGDVAGKLILHYAHQGARAAMPLAGAGKLAAQMRGAARGGAQAAVFIGGSALLLAGGAWAVSVGQRRYLRRKALAELADMQLPDELVAVLEKELAEEVARAVEHRIAPLERMVR